MFEGATALSLDAKGRLAIPARYREPLLAAAEGSLVLTAHPHRCLLLYPSPAWQPIRDQILKGSSLNPAIASIKRVLVGNARSEELDSAGRILVANELREYAHLEKRFIWLVWARISKSGARPAGRPKTTWQPKRCRVAICRRASGIWCCERG